MKNSRTPAYLLALGKQPLPDPIEVAGQIYTLEKVFKHDFFAATALYVGDAGKVILKLGRRASFFGLPLGWIGKWHVRRECRFYAALADLDAVPALLGPYGKHGFVHAYIEGRPLKRKDTIPDDFFTRLRAALDTMHARGTAYVDLEKCENVLVGDDGKPYLIDFQIAWCWPWQFGKNSFLSRWITTKLTRSDNYHLRKLHRRARPDQLSEAELRESYAKPWWVRWHGAMTRPLTLVRRLLLDLVDPKRKSGERGRIVDTTEDSDARTGAHMQS